MRKCVGRAKGSPLNIWIFSITKFWFFSAARESKSTRLSSSIKAMWLFTCDNFYLPATKSRWWEGAESDFFGRSWGLKESTATWYFFTYILKHYQKILNNVAIMNLSNVCHLCVRSLLQTWRASNLSIALSTRVSLLRSLLGSPLRFPVWGLSWGFSLLGSLLWTSDASASRATRGLGVHY